MPLDQIKFNGTWPGVSCFGMMICPSEPEITHPTPFLVPSSQNPASPTCLDNTSSFLDNYDVPRHLPFGSPFPMHLRPWIAPSYFSADVGLGAACVADVVTDTRPRFHYCADAHHRSRRLCRGLRTHDRSQVACGLDLLARFSGLLIFGFHAFILTTCTARFPSHIHAVTSPELISALESSDFIHMAANSRTLPRPLAISTPRKP